MESWVGVKTPQLAWICLEDFSPLIIGSTYVPIRLSTWTGSSQVRGPPVKSTMQGLRTAFPHLAPFFFRVHLYLGIIAESRLLSSLIFIHANYYGEKLCLNIELRVITPGYIVFRGEIKAIGKEVKLRRLKLYTREYNLICIDIQHRHACP